MASVPKGGSAGGVGEGGGGSCARCRLINKSVKKQGLDVRWGGDPIPVHIIYTSCLHWDSEAKNG